MALTKDTLIELENFKTTLGESADEVIVGNEKVVFAEILPDSTIKEYVEPTIQFTKWNKEESLTLSYPDTLFSDKTLVDGELKLSSGKEEFYFRQHDVDTMKFGLILNEIPDASHIIIIEGIEYYQWQFKLEGWENFDFIGPLPESIDVKDSIIYLIAERIGGYGVYHKTKKHNQYKTGKIGIFYCPVFIDANKIKEKAVLFIQDGIYKVSILKEWLDKSAYPVIANDTFGDTQTPDGYDGPKNATTYYVTPFELLVAGDVSSLTVYLDGADSAENVKGLIFDDDSAESGYPETLKGTSSVTVINTTEGQYTFNFSPPISLTAGFWHLGIVFENGGNYFGFQWDDVGYVYRDYTGSYTTPANWGDNARGQYIKLSVYATYTPAAGGGEVTPYGYLSTNKGFW